MYDPPHLLKSIRNNLRNHGFQIGPEDEVQVEAKWDNVVDFYKLDSSKKVRLAPKLTKAHVAKPPVPFGDLRVFYAAQVLSHSVYAGMSVMVQWGILKGMFTFI